MLLMIGVQLVLLGDLSIKEMGAMVVDLEARVSFRLASQRNDNGNVKQVPAGMSAGYG